MTFKPRATRPYDLLLGEGPAGGGGWRQSGTLSFVLIRGAETYLRVHGFNSFTGSTVSRGHPVAFTV
jgi:hypothetical protein